MTWTGTTHAPELGTCEFEVRAVEPLFRRGDADDDGNVNIADAIYTLGCKFLGSACPTCRDAADVNDDGSHDITDAIYTLGFLFLGGPPPPPPGIATCGPDLTDDDLPDCGYTSCGPAEVPSGERLDSACGE